jgi:PleD family two-component response regulator
LLPAHQVIGHCRRRTETVERLEIQKSGTKFSSMMTVNQEIATALPDSNESWRSLLLEAVRALYRAKWGGLA